MSTESSRSSATQLGVLLDRHLDQTHAPQILGSVGVLVWELSEPEGQPRVSLVTLVVARSLVGEPATQKAGDGQSRLAGRPHSEHAERCASFAQA